jgi:hypothetical protein
MVNKVDRFVCPYCSREYNNLADAEKCEARCQKEKERIAARKGLQDLAEEAKKYEGTAYVSALGDVKIITSTIVMSDRCLAYTYTIKVRDEGSTWISKGWEPFTLDTYAPNTGYKKADVKEAIADIYLRAAATFAKRMAEGIN